MFEKQLWLLEFFPYSTQCAHLSPNLGPAANLTLQNGVLSACLETQTNLNSASRKLKMRAGIWRNGNVNACLLCFFTQHFLNLLTMSFFFQLIPLTIFFSSHKSNHLWYTRKSISKLKTLFEPPGH